MYNWLKIENKGEKAVINITGEIGTNKDTSAEQLYNELTSLLNKDVKEITVNIKDSIGGSVIHGAAMFGFLKNSGAKITTFAKGKIASAATYPFMAGSVRNVYKTSEFLPHQSTISVSGNSQTIVKNAEQAALTMSELDNNIALLYKDNSNVELESIKNIMFENNGNGRYIKADELIKLGIATNLINININEMENSDKKTGLWKNTAKFLAKFLGIKLEDAEIDSMENIEELENKLTENNTSLMDVISKLQNELSEKETEITTIKNKSTKTIEVKLTEITEVANKLKEVENRLTAKDIEITDLTNKVKEIEDLKVKEVSEITNKLTKETELKNNYFGILKAHKSDTLPDVILENNFLQVQKIENKSKQELATDEVKKMYNS